MIPGKPQHKQKQIGEPTANDELLTNERAWLQRIGAEQGALGERDKGATLAATGNELP
jgi:hypothetical protein